MHEQQQQQQQPIIVNHNISDYSFASSSSSFLYSACLFQEKQPEKNQININCSLKLDYSRSLYIIETKGSNVFIGFSLRLIPC